MSDTNDDVTQSRTLYCSGFPLDITPREIDFLFQFQPGFVYAKLVDGGKVPIVFITFDTHDQAEACRKLMHGSKLDPNSNVEFRLELAKSTRHTAPPTRKRGAGEPDMNGGKRPRTQEQSYTLMLFNLSTHTTEDEVIPVVKACDGYVKHRWSPSKRGGGSPVCYVDFSSNESAQKAMHELQGATLASLPNGISVKFSEANPGKRGGGGMGGGMGQQRPGPDFGAGFGAFFNGVGAFGSQGFQQQGSSYGGGAGAPSMYGQQQGAPQQYNPYFYQP